ncbi:MULTISPECIES: PrsW family glutamic-type intramembrane protease [Thermoactinomyces]|uniref:Protease PrsW n=1 Tax=Thermoactinomyces daqus TaxID=1329516 RepID=A0A7W2AFZ3_9BACL|nr:MULTISPECIES: PrsW family glutamic-type intramembrane protease [Thermoactinomyces]MBA4541692.1 PrsW family intramembrane metalloprotease [Thermoactinomyces daqus]MBH8597692.1 PrsW family intramembrane metalloprotease [Thermoactinomyces sp. CICC 10523]MBH8604032.1 PrsW family intramembrane metalloprotease [Thermoactinomyces sp. CICC 10522]MBH8606433.1 PrsW family intramembrane metalloprotease [Thermoactinomyces sp. CICC 10521]
MFILLFSAVIPAVLLMIWIYKWDQLHPEPKRHVLRLFVMGALVPLPAALIERHLLITKALSPNPQSLVGILLTAFFVAGAVEELLKALFFYKGIYRHREFDEPIDGVVYAVAVSLGFAMVENILYVSSYGLATAFLRSVTAIPGHMFFGIIMGYYFSRAKMGRSRLSAAFAIPAFFHGVYDSFAMSDGFRANVALLVYLLILLFFSLNIISRLKRMVIN